MKVLFLYPNLNSNPNFKPLVNISRFLSDEGNQVYIATDGEIDDSLKNKFSGSTVFLQRNVGQSKLMWAYSLMDQDFDCYIGVQAHNTFRLVVIKNLFLRRKKIISWEHSSPITSLKNERK